MYICQLHLGRKVWLCARPEFGHLQGKVLVVKKALYGLKSSGLAFCAHLTETLDNIGFKISMANPVVWMRPATKLSGEWYYKYILCYMDDILCISHEASRPMEEIKRALEFKNLVNNTSRMLSRQPKTNWAKGIRSYLLGQQRWCQVDTILKLILLLNLIMKTWLFSKN